MWNTVDAALVPPAPRLCLGSLLTQPGLWSSGSLGDLQLSQGAQVHTASHVAPTVLFVSPSPQKIVTPQCRLSFPCCVQQEVLTDHSRALLVLEGGIGRHCWSLRRTAA